MRMRTELHVFSPEEVRQLCVNVARSRIIGRFFVGVIGPSVLVEMPDGSIEVRTEVREDDLPKAV